MLIYVTLFQYGSSSERQNSFLTNKCAWRSNKQIDKQRWCIFLVVEINDIDTSCKTSESPDMQLIDSVVFSLFFLSYFLVSVTISNTSPTWVIGKKPYMIHSQCSESLNWIRNWLHSQWVWWSLISDFAYIFIRQRRVILAYPYKKNPMFVIWYYWTILPSDHLVLVLVIS